MEKQDKPNYHKELYETAKKIATPGKGILAADESGGTIGKKFVTINVENTEENRRRYREIILTPEGLEQHISGVIFFEETTKQADKNGKLFMDTLKEKGIVSGIKLDKGLVDLPGFPGEQATIGLDDLAKRAKSFYDLGCRFAKWRNVLKITDKLPSETAIKECAWTLARYASICQENGLVPIVEPEILSDGDHELSRCQEVTEKVLAAVYKALNDQKVYLEGTLLKPNMVTPGSSCPKKYTPVDIARATVTALSRTVPPAVTSINFLSGGWSEEEASLYLNEINKIDDIRRPWNVSFSYGRALQNSAVKTWAGKDENFKAAQEALLKRAKAHGLSQLGKYTGSTDATGQESLNVKGYTY